MNITCLHGYFIFREDSFGEVATFNSLYAQSLSAKDDYYTFTFLRDAPNYSIVSKPYLNLPATKTFAGMPWEVMAQNGFVYDVGADALKPILTVPSQTDPRRLATSFSLRTLIPAGSLDETLRRISGYQCRLDIGTFTYNYSELFYA